MIVCVRICPIVSAYIFRHKTISLLCEDLYHTSYTNTFVEIPSAPSAPQGTTMREPSFVDHMAASIVSADSMHAKVEDHRVIATPCHRLQQPPLNPSRKILERYWWKKVTAVSICSLYTLSVFISRVNVLWNINFLPELSSKKKKNTKQLGDTTCF